MINKVVVAIGLFAVSSISNAQFVGGATISGVGCDANNTCFMNLANGPLTSCSNNTQVRWDGSTPQGRSWLASALTAKASGAPINLGTLDTCQNSGQFDTVNFITVAE